MTKVLKSFEELGHYLVVPRQLPAPKAKAKPKSFDHITIHAWVDDITATSAGRTTFHREGRSIKMLPREVVATCLPFTRRGILPITVHQAIGLGV